MPVICPTVLASTKDKYEEQLKKVSHFAHRIQIDLTDGEFAKANTIDPKDAWWPAGIKADFHLMYKNPLESIQKIIEHKPHLIIVHAESDGDFGIFAESCHRVGVKVGVALLPQTDPKLIVSALHHIDHVLIFSGDLGHFGGQADLSLLHKAAYLKSHDPAIEIGWDGGINDQNVSALVSGGVDVLNVGGYIQNADNPERAYKTLDRIADETGET